MIRRLNAAANAEDHQKNASCLDGHVMIFHDVSPPSPPSPPSWPGVSAGPSIRLGISCSAPSPSAAATYSRIKAQLCASPYSLQLCRSGRRARGGATQLDFLRLSAESEKKPESIRRHQKIPSEVPEKTSGHASKELQYQRT